MDKIIIENELLQINHIPGKGAWTYNIVIPNTKDIKGKAGSIRVNGSIDNYEIINRSLVLVTNGDKMLPINQDIRNTLNKTGGDFVTVTMSLVGGDISVTEIDILDCFKDAEVLGVFEKMNDTDKNDIIRDILSGENVTSQEKKILWYINKFSV